MNSILPTNEVSGHPGRFNPTVVLHTEPNHHCRESLRRLPAVHGGSVADRLVVKSVGVARLHRRTHGGQIHALAQYGPGERMCLTRWRVNLVPAMAARL